MTQRPGSSTATLVGSQAFFNGALAVTVICLGRWLQREELGLYFYALSLGSLLEILVHWGAQHYVNREAAARFDEARELLPSFLWLSALSVTVVTFGLIPLHGWPVALTTAAALIRAGAGVLGAIFIGRRQVWPTVLSRVASQVLLLTGLWLVVRGRPSLAATSILLVAVAIVHIGIQLGCLPRIGMTMKATIAEWPGVWRRLVRPILPFVLLFFLGQFHYRADAVLIEWLAGLDAVSVLMLAFKWVEGVFFVPAVVASAAIPYLTSSLDEEERLTRMLKAYTFALAAGLMCLSVVLLVAGGPALTYPSRWRVRGFHTLLPPSRVEPAVARSRVFLRHRPHRPRAGTRPARVDGGSRRGRHRSKIGSAPPVRPVGILGRPSGRVGCVRRGHGCATVAMSRVTSNGQNIVTSSPHSYAMRGPVWALVVVVLGLHLAAAAAPELLWGGHHLSFVPLPYQIALYVLVLVLTVPSLQEATILAFAKSLGRRVRLLRWRFGCAVAAAVVLGIAVFCGLQIQHTIFGDATVRLSELNGASAPVAPWYRGDTVVRFYLHSLFKWLWNPDPAQSFAATSILYGVFFLIAAAGITRRLAHTAAEAGLLFGALTTSGFVLLFCGYIEVYSSTVALELLFLWGVVTYSAGSVRLWLPATLLLLLGFFHVLGLFVGPALAYAIIYRHGLDRHLGPVWRRRCLFVLIAASVLGGWALYQLVRPTSAIPLVQSCGHIPYTLLSSAHILYLVNESILVALPGWMALFVAIFLSSKDPASGRDEANDPLLKALVAGGVASFFMMGVVNPFLGSLDWDLMSIHSPAWVLMGTYLLVVRSRRYGGISSHTATVIVTLSLFHTIPWIALQQFPVRAAKAIEAMVENDPHRAGDRNLKLGIRFEELGFIDEAIHQYEKAIEWDDGYYLSYYNLGRVYEKMSDLERSTFYYLEAIELNPSYPKTYNNLGGIYHRKRRLADAVTNYEKAIELDPRHAGAHANLGLAHYEQSNYQRAVDAFERCLDIDPAMDHVYFNLSAAYGKSGDYPQAARALRQFVARRPLAAAAYLNLGNTYRQIGDVESARAAYERFVELAPDDPHAAAAAAFLKASSQQR